MKDIQDLVDAVQELESLLAKCTRCGMCQAVCPVFRRTGDQADVTRGKLALLDGLAQRMFDDPGGVNDRLNRCLLCGTCQHNCPSGVDILYVFLKARTVIARYQGMGKVKQLFFKQVLARPRLFNRISELGRSLSLLVFNRPEYPGRAVSARAPFRAVFPAQMGNRHVVFPAEKPFHASISRHPAPVGPGGKRVVFFTGCLIDSVFPQIAHSAMAVFDALKIHCQVPSQQGCCGIPALASGDEDTFDALVTHHLDLLSFFEFDYLVTACATCSATIKTIWPSMARDKDSRLRARLDSLAQKTMDINRFLVSHTGLLTRKSQVIPRREAVCYHDPCHLKHAKGGRSAPRKIIQAAGYELRELKAPDACCGMGGSFNLAHYGVSKEIGLEKAADIICNGCRIVATSCPACMIQIADALSSSGNTCPVCHPVELLAKGLTGRPLLIDGRVRQTGL